jgi:hypothetical protein
MYYFLSNLHAGDSRRLDTYSGPAGDAFMAKTLGTAGQFWKITALGGGLYRLTNQFHTEAKSLEPTPDAMRRLYLGGTADVAKQKWRIRATGPGLFRLTNVGLGDGYSLDTENDPQEERLPFMNTTANVSGQAWKIVKAP